MSGLFCVLRSSSVSHSLRPWRIILLYSTNLVLPNLLPETGRFELRESRRVVDVANGATLQVSSTKEMDTFGVEFQFESLSIRGTLQREPKYPERPIVRESPENPTLRIMVHPWFESFRSQQMADRQFNSRLVLYMTHMIAFGNAISLEARAFLWSDYNLVRKRYEIPPFDMPSDQELITISAAW